MTSERTVEYDDPPRWFALAATKLGVREVPGAGTHPEILAWHQTTTLKATSDEVPWCSAFVNAMMQYSGIAGTHSAAASSWETWGSELLLPKLGCVVVFDHHVALYVRHTDPRTLHVLSGNQHNMVCGEDYPLSRVLSFRWPKTA